MLEPGQPIEGRRPDRFRPSHCAWPDFIKKLSERTNEPVTPAMRLGLADRPWTWSDVLSKRRFPGRLQLPEGWDKIYRRGWITPAVGRNVAHALRHAF